VSDEALLGGGARGGHLRREGPKGLRCTGGRLLTIDGIAGGLRNTD